MAHYDPTRDRTLAGLSVHLSLWLLLLALIVFTGRASLFPGRPHLTWILLSLPPGALVSLWFSRRSRSLAMGVLNALSLALWVIVLAELTVASVKPRELAVTRFPYPYRMHGAAPLLQPSGSHLNMTTNDSGLRDAESIPRKPVGELRVVVLGGSAILGTGVADDETAPHQLERMLSRHLAQSPIPGLSSVRVINAGQGYYNSTQELVFLVTELAIYEPDVIVVADGYNDLHHAVVWGNRPSANEVTTAMMESLMHGGGAVQRVGWPDAAFSALQASYFANRTRGGIASRVVAPTDLGFPMQSPRSTRQDPQFMPLVKHRLIMNWTLIHGLAESFGARAIFSLQPTIFVKDALSTEERQYIESTEYAELVGRNWREFESFVEGEAMRLGLPTFDADSYIERESGRMFFDYCHLLGEGNRLMAQAMAERIEADLADWPWEVDWAGVRYGLDEGDPIWRPDRLATVGEWR